MTDVRIEKVSSKQAMRRFVKFPYQVYRGDPNWVPPMLSDVRAKLNPRKNPFFDHAEVELFLAYRGDVLAGRIAAIRDENHNRVHQDKVAFFGMYESFNDPEVARALIDHAAAWASERGMETLRGPMNLSMNDECAFLSEGFDSPPVLMMTYNPPFYLGLMEQSGLVKAKDLYAFYMHRDRETDQKISTIVDKVRKSTSITLRTITRKTLKEDVEKVRSIYNQSWERNWGFVPWTDAEIDHMAKTLIQFADWDLVILAEDKGNPVGFAFGLPNYNEVLIKMNGRVTPQAVWNYLRYRRKITGIRAVVFGILKEYRMTGLSYYLYWLLQKNSLANGYTWAETSWQLEDNHAINRFVSSIGGKIYKKYRIFERPIETGKPE